jgi:hypothetical protein
MKRAQFPALGLLLAACWAWLGLAGCGSPLVGLECAEGHTRCGSEGACFDLQSDERNCGGCDMRCGAGEMCIAGGCTDDFDGSMPDGDGGMDGQVGDSQVGDGQIGDGQTGDGQVGDGQVGDGQLGDGQLDGQGGDGEARDADTGWSDADLPPLCMGPGSPENCVCELGELVCEASCVNANIDTENCGACGNDCNVVPPANGEYFCINGQCILDCTPPYVVCNNTCVDTTEDPDNCGGCGIECESGLCENRLCLDATAGHVIVIGHDMSNALPAAQRLAANAMFLPAKGTLSGLVYDRNATGGAASAVHGLIAATAAARGRTFTEVASNPGADSVPFLLSQVDVFVIVAQANATDDELRDHGDDWSRALRGFLVRGGVVVLFDGGGTNAGTHQILQQAGLFSAQARMSLAPRTVHIEAAADAVASSVPIQYQAQSQTVGFDTTEQTVVVRDRSSGLAVVIHVAR